MTPPQFGQCVIALGQGCYGVIALPTEHLERTVTEQQREQRGISRRTIAKGAAWTVPALPLMAAAPAYAASGGPPSGFFESACKQPGNSCNNRFGPGNPGFIKGYTFVVNITNTSGELIYIYPTLNGTLNPYFEVTSSVPFSYASARRFTGGAIGTPLLAAEPIPNGGSLRIIINAGTNSNSANTDAVGTLFLAWGHTQTVGGDPDHPYTPAPPDANVGEGWFEIPFSFASTPPCGTDCAPGGDETEGGAAAVEEESTLEEQSVETQSTEGGSESSSSTDTGAEQAGETPTGEATVEETVEIPESTATETP